MADAIEQHYTNKELIIVGVLNGAFVLVADLVRKLSIRPEVHFTKYASYIGTAYSGQVKKELEVNIDFENRNVLIVEDIVDTGNTLERIITDFESHQPASLKIASLFLKPDVYDKAITIDFIGKEIPNDFVIGYGMDIDGKGRELKEIYKIKTV